MKRAYMLPQALKETKRTDEEHEYNSDLRARSQPWLERGTELVDERGQHGSGEVLDVVGRVVAIGTLDGHDEVEVIEATTSDGFGSIEEPLAVGVEDRVMRPHAGELRLHEWVRPEDTLEVDEADDLERVRVDEHVEIPEIPVHEVGFGDQL